MVCRRSSQLSPEPWVDVLNLHAIAIEQEPEPGSVTILRSDGRRLGIYRPHCSCIPIGDARWASVYDS